MPTVVYVAPAALCVASWFGAGRLIPRRRLPDDPLVSALTRCGAGATAFALASYLAGRAHAYRRPVLIAATVALALLALPELRAAVRFRRPRPTRGVVAIATVVLVALALDLAAASAPPTSVDALKYHLALPKLWLASGGIDDSFWRWESFNPFATEMLFGQAEALGGGIAASALGGALACLAAGAVYALGRRVGGSGRAGLAAIALFTLQGVFTWESTSAFVELTLTFFVALAAWYLVDATAGSLPWAGFFAGAAAGTKYVGLQAWLVLLPLLVVAVRRAGARAAAGAGVLAACAGGLWYVKNAVVTGNPVYPLFGAGKWWTPASQRAIDELDRSYGVHASVLRLPLLPVDLLVHGGAFDRGQYVGPAIFVAGIAALVLTPAREALLLFAGAVLFAISWWYLSPQARFLLPALAVAAAVGGGAVVELASRGRVAAVVVAVAAAAVVVDWAAPSLALTRTAAGVVTGATTRAAYLERETGTYNVLQAAARQAHGTLALSGYPFVFHVPRRAIAVDLPEFATDVPTAVFRARLRREGVATILDADGRIHAYRQLDGCLTPLRRYRARFVLSRSLGTSRPIRFVLYRVARACIR